MSRVGSTLPRKQPKPWHDVRMMMRDYVYAVLEENERSTILSGELREAFKSALATLRKNTRKVSLAKELL